MTKKKIIEILITALLSAGIAFLQSLLANRLEIPSLTNDPQIAGILGATIHSIRTFRA